MGVYAQTSIEITCKTNKSAKEVAKVIKKAKKENDDNFDFLDLEADGELVYLEKNSCRCQNLEYQCEKLWELIKDIKGVIEMTCPFLIEGESMYFENETKKD